MIKLLLNIEADTLPSLREALDDVRSLSENLDDEGPLIGLGYSLWYEISDD